MPSLTTLPAKLRAQIYGLALIHNQPLSIKGAFPDYHPPTNTKPLTRSHLALTQTSRLLRRETLPLFYSTNTFAICLQPVSVQYWRTKKGRVQLIFRRSYGDYTTAAWVASLSRQAISSLRLFAVHVACVTRWRGDEMQMERAKCKHYGMAERKTGKMAVHVLYDGCGSWGTFYEVDLVGGTVLGAHEEEDDDDDDDDLSDESEEESEDDEEGEDDEDDDEDDGEGEEDVMVDDPPSCKVCKKLLRHWLYSLATVNGSKRATKAKLLALMMPSGLPLAPRRGDARI